LSYSDQKLMFTFQQISNIVKGKVLSNQQDSVIKNFIFDSRNYIPSHHSIFISINGINHDGHKYINELAQRGIKNFIVEKEITPPSESNVVKVENSVKALQKLAEEHRAKFIIPVIAITGSNGKTIIKEWLSQVLSKKYNLVKSPKSYNSQLGVPLSVLKMEPEHTLGIFEAGISKVGEMRFLNKVIQPSIGIFTNIGSAHDEGFESREQKASEKWELFRGAGVAIYCKDHEIVDATKPYALQAFTWGKSESSDVQVLSTVKDSHATRLRLNYNGEEFWFELPFREQASLENAMHLIALCLLLKLDHEFIQSAISELKGVSMRLEVKKGINQCILIDDTYNNDLAGIRSALEFLKNQSLDKTRTLILSDIFSVKTGQSYVAELSALADQYQVNRFIGVGNELKKGHELFKCERTFYETTQQLLDEFDKLDFFNEAILIKGARPFEFEKVSRKLSQKIHGTKLEINLNALSHNLSFYKSLLKPDVKTMVMVKAFAYGSGGTEIANLLQFHKIDYLAVAYADEGVELRKQGISVPIMVMNVNPESFDKILEYRLEPEIYAFEQLNALLNFIDKKGSKTAAHLKIDTGMKRLGFEQNEIEQLISQLKPASDIAIASIFTHLAGSDEEIHNDFSLQQLKSFLNISETIIGAIGYKPLLHALNSPGIVRFPDYQLDMVRLGIGLYGYESCGIYQDKLQPISTLKTEISQIKYLEEGETVGYARKGVAHQKSKIATIAIGYADGFSRAFSNGRISVYVNGKLAPVIGNVCMDMCTIDITGINAKIGDEVIIFGEKPTIQDLAEAIHTIPYEILTNVSERVKRVYFSE